MSTSLAWDERYSGGGFQFGTTANEYLQAQARRLRAGMTALSLGDGEGRNGVWLAKQGLAVTTLDWSGVGVAKAREFAASEGVAIDARQGDAAGWDWPEAAFDVIAWIYMHLPPGDRDRAAAGCRRALRPGGLLILEGFSPAQEGRRSGGPKDPSLLWTRAIVEAAFPSLEVLELTEGAVRLDEGPRHQGLAEVVRGVLRNP
ncbi:SAM-dependent methyltransferase [Roseococcus sp. YIM B11640]|uniref:SAM-dependent methyltransferase n=1 Tax=Roseococcus sp. YIM B11640 TaxID=3133973 RepID=UPI003C7DE948